MVQKLSSPPFSFVSLNCLQYIKSSALSRMADILRESPLGQIIRFVTRGRYLRYPEEVEGFQIPWEQNLNEKHVASTELDKELEAATSPSANTSVQRENEPHQPHPLSKVATEREQAFMPDHDLIAAKSRESTTPWSEERFDVERQHSLLATESRVIQPQKTSDGIILVDWYTTDDPANPQNWSSGKKGYVSFLILSANSTNLLI